MVIRKSLPVPLDETYSFFAVAALTRHPLKIIMCRLLSVSSAPFICVRSDKAKRRRFLPLYTYAFVQDPPRLGTLNIRIVSSPEDDTLASLI